MDGNEERFLDSPYRLDLPTGGSIVDAPENGMRANDPGPAKPRASVTAGLAVALFLLAGVGCGEPAPRVDENYENEIRAWRADRDERLRSETGWLTLVGLYWLEPGENRFGGRPDNEVALPGNSVPPRAGSLILDGSRVVLRALPGSGVLIDGEPVTERVLATDEEEKPDVFRLGDLRLHIIRRGDRFGVRVKDPNSPVRTGFRGLDCFPLDPAYRVVGEFVPYDPPKEMVIPTAVGTTETTHSPGFVRFTLGGTELTLDPVAESPEDSLFFIFKDGTSGKETYGAGRFLIADPPEDGRVILDFNRAYNPPCVFTPYATCPLPPKQNWLPVRVEAGEKVYGEH